MLMCSRSTDDLLVSGLFTEMLLNKVEAELCINLDRVYVFARDPCPRPLHRTPALLFRFLVGP